jgi:hypothetical protein
MCIICKPHHVFLCALFPDHLTSNSFDEGARSFPPGLRIMVGDPFTREPPESSHTVIDYSQGEIMPVQWVCPRSNKDTPLYPLDSDGLSGVGIGDPTVEDHGVGFADIDCDGYASPLRADIHFPSCYNPLQNVRNYRANMMWPVNGSCPADTLRVPRLFYEIYWNTSPFAER